jgi:hypothetical protein
MACVVTALILVGRVGRLTLGESRVVSDKRISGHLDGHVLTIRGLETALCEGSTLAVCGTFVSVTSTAVRVSTDRPTVYVNGVAVAPANSPAQKDAACEIVCPGTAWHYKLESITHKGSSTFAPPAACFVGVHSVCVRIHGSGDVMLPALALSNLSVNVLGSGGVLARGVRAQHVRADVLGSGDIVGVHAAQTLHARVAGSGDITVGVSETCTVQQDALGSGRIVLSVE